MTEERLVIQMARRILTKKHKFDFEMKYRPVFQMYTGSYIGGLCKKYKNGLTLTLLDEITSHIDIAFYKKENIKLAFSFFDDFKDVIKWERTIFQSNLVHDKFTKFIDRYYKYFTQDIWHGLSCTYKCYASTKFIRKYKDYLDWSYISILHNFTPEFLLEMKDYVDMKYLLSSKNPNSVVMDKFSTYLSKHLEEALNGKREDDSNE